MISLEWVKDYIDISDQDLEELAVKITQSGINVEKVITNHIDNLVVGEVIDCVNHPDSDHLHVCQVAVSENDVLQIVCGAPNVRKGLKVVVALPGAVLPEAGRHADAGDRALLPLPSRGHGGHRPGRCRRHGGVRAPGPGAGLHPGAEDGL